MQLGPSGKRRRPEDGRRAKRVKQDAASLELKKKREEDTIRVEQLSYKVDLQSRTVELGSDAEASQRLLSGTRVLSRIHTVLPLHLILSLPNNLLAHVPITEISSKLTSLLEAEERDSSSENDENDGESSTSNSPPDLAQLFRPGQYFPARVINSFPTASQSFISQYPVSETTRLAARTEMTLKPEQVNSEVSKEDLKSGYLINGAVLSEEDKGFRIGLGLNNDSGASDVEGWISKAEVETSERCKLDFGDTFVLSLTSNSSVPHCRPALDVYRQHGEQVWTSTTIERGPFGSAQISITSSLKCWLYSARADKLGTGHCCHADRAQCQGLRLLRWDNRSCASGTQGRRHR